MTMFQMMTLGLLFISSYSLAQTNECLSELISSNETHRLFPQLSIQARNNNFDERTLTFLAETEKFCECHEKNKKPKEIFSDTISNFANEDNCAGKNLLGESFQVHIEITQLKLSHEITKRLTQRYPRAIRQLASGGSYNRKISCLHEVIFSNCVRSHSLKMGYQCIQEITTSRNFSKYESKCPEFNDDPVQITQHNDLMI